MAAMLSASETESHPEIAGAAPAGPTQQAPRRRSRFFALSLSRILGLTFALLTTLSIAGVLGLVVSANVKNTFSLLNTRSEEGVGSLKLVVDAYLEPAALTVRSMAGQVRKGEIDFNDDEQMFSILRGAIAANRMVVALILYDRDYNARGVFREGSEFGTFREAGVQNPGVRQAISLLSHNHEPHWGPIVRVDGQVHANVAQVIYRGDEHIGYLAAAVPLPRISHLLSEATFSDDFTPFILDGPDNVLAHAMFTRPQGGAEPAADGAQALQRPAPGAEPGPPPRDGSLRPPPRDGGLAPPPGPAPGQGDAPSQGGVGEAAVPGGAVTPLRETFPDPVLQGFDTREPGDMFEAALERGVEVSLVDLGGDDQYIVMTATIDDYAVRPWIIGLYSPLDTVDREVERLVGSTVVGLVLMALSAFVAYWLGRRIGRPIGKLNAMMAKVTTLDFDAVKPMPPSHIRELNESARVLNAMVDALRAFSAYVPRSLVTKLIAQGSEGAARSVERTVTLMFTDIAGFTALSEHMTAAETAAFLNEHFSILCGMVEETDGTVDKFMGDGMMAFWGAPDPTPDHADRAAEAARAMAKAMRAFNAKRSEAGLPPVRVRIGIHTGPVVVGNIGPSDRMNYTIVGDTVNACQRLEALGKVVAPDAEIVVLTSADTHAALPDAVEQTALSAFSVPGREAPIQVYRLSV